jgi:hypothetical protein
MFYARLRRSRSCYSHTIYMFPMSLLTMCWIVMDQEDSLLRRSYRPFTMHSRTVSSHAACYKSAAISQRPKAITAAKLLLIALTLNLFAKLSEPRLDLRLPYMKILELIFANVLHGAQQSFGVLVFKTSGTFSASCLHPTHYKNRI